MAPPPDMGPPPGAPRCESDLDALGAHAWVLTDDGISLLALANILSGFGALDGDLSPHVAAPEGAALVGGLVAGDGRRAMVRDAALGAWRVDLPGQRLLDADPIELMGQPAAGVDVVRAMPGGRALLGGANRGAVVALDDLARVDNDLEQAGLQERAWVAGRVAVGWPDRVFVATDAEVVELPPTGAPMPVLALADAQLAGARDALFAASAI